MFSRTEPARGTVQDCPRTDWDCSPGFQITGTDIATNQSRSTLRSTTRAFTGWELLINSQDQDFRIFDFRNERPQLLRRARQRVWKPIRTWRSRAKCCHTFRVVNLTQDEFQVIYEALELANSGWADDDVQRLVLLEAQAWEVVNRKMDEIRRETAIS